MYTDFAYIYDELIDDVDYKSWSLYIRNIFDKFHKKPKSLLEMACGTGNLSYHLAKAGYDLTCFDISDDMLAVAYNKLSQFNNVMLLKQNMINFYIGKKFDGVISILDSINYIVDHMELLNTFKNVRSHLKEDGIFIFDINSQYKLKEIIGNNIFIEDTENVFYTWQNYYDEEKDIVEFYLTFFVKKEKDKYIRFDEEHLERAYSVEEIVRSLEKAGFKEVYFFDCFTFEKPHHKSERINFVALP
ncbi:MAG: class I SAM-dependent methyltransferase [Tissierellia bacterium]|nr:class I SAM-dependent methyltransferase [Tissierellia bacterium]